MTENSKLWIHIYSAKKGRVTVDIRVNEALITVRGTRITKCGNDGYIVAYGKITNWVDTRGFKVTDDIGVSE